MKAARLLRWSGSVLSPRTRPSTQLRQLTPLRRWQSTAAAAAQSPLSPFSDSLAEEDVEPSETHLPSPLPSRARTSAKLSALHARLALPSRFPLETLARCLVDASADPNPSFNNESLSVLGRDVLGYHTSEVIVCRYPRLPMAVTYAVMRAYIGGPALAVITREWGVDNAAYPGGEVDPGLLQFKKVIPGNADVDRSGVRVKDNAKTTEKPWNRGISSLSIGDNYFGDFSAKHTRHDLAERPELKNATGVTYEEAATRFVQALIGAVYLHGGRAAAKDFYKAHFQSRSLDVGKMFEFKQATKDLSRLCAREGFEPPVARIISETGRTSRHPVFVVGVFSGREKLGEASGASLDEARVRAAVAALKGWYLYSPLSVRVPSDVEDGSADWEPVLIDGGEVVV
jgi:dsRNA-specific ribonuclease